MFGDANGASEYKFADETASATSKGLLMKTERFTATDVTVPTTTSASGWNNKFTAPDGKVYEKVNPRFFDVNGAVPKALVKGESYFCTYDLKIDGMIIDVSANAFPGTLMYRAPLRGNKILANQIGELLETAA